MNNDNWRLVSSGVTFLPVVVRFHWLRQLRCQGPEHTEAHQHEAHNRGWVAGTAGQRNTSLLTSVTESSVHSTSQGSLHTHTHTGHSGTPQASPGAGTTDHSSRQHV
ncbi:hypothetical protein E2C01_089038 [Portunus trituberculatus]|uniref:Uncharacterized protein n=1 Tax=Portunus trituberculatus TaxID=210409 RepID=A0A5B7JHP0_PORTR|nr:hypothetical protein [Portunus trituberculatus]